MSKPEVYYRYLCVSCDYHVDRKDPQDLPAYCPACGYDGHGVFHFDQVREDLRH